MNCGMCKKQEMEFLLCANILQCALKKILEKVFCIPIIMGGRHKNFEGCQAGLNQLLSAVQQFNYLTA